MVVAYVYAKDGKVLSPMHSHTRVRKFIKSGKAVIIKRKPLVIKLTYEIKNPKTNRTIFGQDTGRTNIGSSCITDNGTVLYMAETTTCNKDVPKHMKERKEHRMASRRGERKVRQRRAIKNSTIFKESTTRERVLPKCNEPIVNKYIKNTEAKFANRKRNEHWLTPTARHLLNTLIRNVEEVHSLLPVTDIVIEVTKWDFAKLQNPNIKNWQYQKGKLHRYESIEEAVFNRQSGKCLMCKNKIEHYHHIIPKSKGGSEKLENRCGLCGKCHDKVHKNIDFETKLKTKQEGLLKEYGALSVMNQVMPYYIEYLSTHYENVYVTNGYETKKLREEFNLPKTHSIDAFCIASSIIDTDFIALSTIEEIKNTKPYEIKQFRNQDRAIIRAQRERTYKYNGKIVSKNRHKRTEQKTDSLEEWFNKQVDLYGLKIAEAMRSQLSVTKSTRYYNDKNRLMPGTVFLYENKRYVLSGQLTNGTYYRAVGFGDKNFPSKDCVVILHNDGLVYL